MNEERPEGRPPTSQRPSQTGAGYREVGTSVGAGGPEALARLESYRAASQAIRRSDGTFEQRMVRLIDLMQAGRAEPDPWVRSVAEQIVWAQGEWMIQDDEVLRRHGVRDRLQSAARRLRLQGHESCPTCEQRLSDPADWSFWAALRRAELDRLAALEREAGEAA